MEVLSKLATASATAVVSPGGFGDAAWTSDWVADTRSFMRDVTADLMRVRGDDNGLLLSVIFGWRVFDQQDSPSLIYT